MFFQEKLPGFFSTPPQPTLLYHVIWGITSWQENALHLCKKHQVSMFLYWLYHPVPLAVRTQTRLHPNSPCFSVLPLRWPQPCSPRGVTQHGCCHAGGLRLPPDPLPAAPRCPLPFPTATHHLEPSVMAVQLSPRPQEDEQHQVCLAL